MFLISDIIGVVQGFEKIPYSMFFGIDWSFLELGVEWG